MNVKEGIVQREQPEAAALKESLRHLVGRHSLPGVLHGLADLAVDWREGRIGDGEPLEPDRLWQSAGKHLKAYAVRVETLFKNWRDS